MAHYRGQAQTVGVRDAIAAKIKDDIIIVCLNLFNPFVLISSVIHFDRSESVSINQNARSCALNLSEPGNE